MTTEELSEWLLSQSENSKTASGAAILFAIRGKVLNREVFEPGKELWQIIDGYFQPSIISLANPDWAAVTTGPPE